MKNINADIGEINCRWYLASATFLRKDFFPSQFYQLGFFLVTYFVLMQPLKMATTSIGSLGSN